MDAKLCVAKIISSHGINGLVKIKSFVEDSNNLINYGTIYDKSGNIINLNIKFLQVKTNCIIAKVEGINSKFQAESVKNKELFISKSYLPKTEQNEYYIHDLIGLNIVSIPDNNDYGYVKSIQDYGAGPIIEIELIQNNGNNNLSKQHKNNITEMYVFNDATFPEVNIEKKYITFKKPIIIDDV